MADAIAIENFREYLRIRTVQPKPDYAGAMKFLKKMADELGLEFETVEMVSGKPIGIINWNGASSELPSILLNSHTDVVPVSEAHWDVDPFAATMDDQGRIIARGAQDMKCVGIGYIEAIRRLTASGFKPNRNIFLTFVPDEEIGGVDGMKAFVKTEKFKSMNVGVALDEGIPSPFDFMFIFNQERAPWWIKITAHGVAGHGSGLPQGTAIEKLFRVMQKIFKFRDEQIKQLAGRVDQIGNVTSVNVTKMDGGVQTNVIPNTASITVDSRVSPLLGQDGFQKILDDWTDQEGLEISFEEKAPMPPASPGNPGNLYYDIIAKTLEEFGISHKVEIFPGATDSRYIREAGILAYGFSPFNLTPILLHDHNEYLTKDIFLKGIGIYEKLIAKLALA